MKGKFITFEGSEGTGKSTHSRLLARYLRRKGYRVILLREPGCTAISEKIRSILLDNGNKSITPLCETLLYMAARAQLAEKVIAPALLEGKIVICDRFMDSTIAYQGYGLGIDIKAIKYIGNFSSGGIRPDLTIFLDLAVKKALGCRRLKDRIEKRSLSYHERVRQGYLKLALLEPGRIKIIKVHDDKSATQKNVRKMVDKFLSLR